MGLLPTMKHRFFHKLASAVVLLLTYTTLSACQATPPPTPNLLPKPQVQSTQASTTRFVAIGDMGSRMAGQFKLATAMANAYQQHPFTFALTLGDNIYPDGDVKRRGEASFTQPYKPLLDAGVRFYPSLGNHDVDSGFMADQLDFFKMPARYYSFTQGNVRCIALDTNQFDPVQQQWLKRQLSQPLPVGKPPYWTIVYGHHPIFSSGMHGNNASLFKSLKPLLEGGHVDLYLAGHDHDYERFTPVNGVTYIVSGGGGASLRPFGLVPATGSLVRQSTLEFIQFEATPTQLRYTTTNIKGLPLDEGALTREANMSMKQSR
jgi:hypothetical protein